MITPQKDAQASVDLQIDVPSSGKKLGATRAALLALALGAPPAAALPGYLIAAHDPHPDVPESQVVVARDGERTVLTIAPTYVGGDASVALIYPVPAPFSAKQVNVAEPGLVEQLAAYSAPRLVEIQDQDPCQGPEAPGSPAAAPVSARVQVRGVLGERAYDEGEVTTEILSGAAAKSPGTWLAHHGFKASRAAERALRPYVKAKADFVVARYQLSGQRGTHGLKPLQLAFESRELRLPLLGETSGRETLHVYGLTRGGRLEASAPPTARLPSDLDLPDLALTAPRPFWDAVVAKAAGGREAAFLELAWDGRWCDPCVADPLTPSELRLLGAYWVSRNAKPPKAALRSAVVASPPADVFVTRLLVTWTGAPKSELVLGATTDRSDLQEKFQVRRPFAGGQKSCDALAAYDQGAAARREAEVETLARLTGWDSGKIRRRLNLSAPPAEDQTWIDDLWH